MKKPLLSTLLAALIVSAAPAAMAQNIAIVNGKPIPSSRLAPLREQVQQQMGREIPPEMDDKLKEELILREIFMQEALRRGLDKTNTYRDNMEMMRERVLIQQLFLDFNKKNPVSDAEIKAEYDRFVAANSGNEYRASHILVADEARAKAIISEIKNGKKFADIAKAESTDPGSGSRGGDLGWANDSRYVPEFSKAMIALKKGELTAEPVQSQFGWHIIRLDDIRETKLPALEDIRHEITQELEEKKMSEFQKTLREKAKIE